MMEQLAERRMQREEYAAGAIEAESEEDREENSGGSERDDDGDDEDDMSEDEDDEEEEEADEVVRTSLFVSIQPYIYIFRPCPRMQRCRKAKRCFLSLLHACSNNVYYRPIERKSLRNANYNFSANLMMKIRLPGIVR